MSIFVEFSALLMDLKIYQYKISMTYNQPMRSKLLLEQVNENENTK